MSKDLRMRLAFIQLNAHPLNSNWLGISGMIKSHSLLMHVAKKGAKLRLDRCWMITAGWSLTLARWQKCSTSSFHQSLQPRTYLMFQQLKSSSRDHQRKNWLTSKSLLNWCGKNCRRFGQTSPQEPMICHRGY